MLAQVWGEAYGETGAPESFSFRSYNAISGQTAMVHSSQYSVVSHPFTRVANMPSWNLPSAYEKPLFYVYVYLGIGLASTLAGFISTVIQYIGSYLASRTMFKRLLGGVVGATMRWHDTTPQGV